MNLHFVRCMEENGCTNPLIQDGRKMRSTEYIHAHLGLPLDQITSVEGNYKIHRQHIKNGINSFFGELWSQVIDFENIHAPYDALMLDTVNSLTTLVSGCRLENLFRNGYIAPRAVVLITGTKRSNQRGAKWENDYAELKRMFKHFASKYKYHCELYMEQEQTKVVTVMYTLVRRY